MTFQQNALRFGKKAEFVLRRNAPSIMTYVGVGGFIATVGLAIRATNKANEVAPKLRQAVKDVKDENALAKTMTKKEASERLAKVYVETGWQLTKIYAPTLLTGSASIALVLGGHGMMAKRQAQLVAVYAALDASYKAYRQRIRDEFGDDVERNIYTRPSMRALDETENEGDLEACELIDLGDTNPSPYARFFDDASPNWTKTAEWNLMFLRAQEQWANDRLNNQGFLFLNEVYEALGLPRSQAGQIVGWKHNGSGDGFVSFGLGNIWDDNARAFINGLENVALLDFNVDGIIKI
jgi:hypothetical protein